MLQQLEGITAKLGKGIPEGGMEITPDAGHELCCSLQAASQQALSEALRCPGLWSRRPTRLARKRFSTCAATTRCLSPATGRAPRQAACSALPINEAVPHCSLLLQLSQDSKDLLEKMAQDGHVSAASEAARFPMAIGPLREDRDHQDQPSLVVDVVLHTTILRHSHAFKCASQAAGIMPGCSLSKTCSLICRPMKLCVVSLVLTSVCEKHGIKLDKRYKLPKMRYKGSQPVPQIVRREKSALISEVRLLFSRTPKQQHSSPVCCLLLCALVHPCSS